MIPTVPKPAPERTFVVAASILGIFALIQLIGVVVVLAPQVRFSSNVSPSAAQANSGNATVTPEGRASEDAIAAANRFLDEADQARARGDIQAGLEALAEADHAYPNDPGILFQMGVTLEQAGKRVEATSVYNAILALPANPSNPARERFGRQAQNRLSVIGGGGAGGPAAPSRTLMRDSVGIPIGSMMGIVDSRVVDSEPGFKHLRVATKADPAEEIDPGELQVAVFFYEQNDTGEVLRADSAVQSEWLSPPTDWSNDEPELVDIRYPLPADDRGDLPPLEYHGYVLGIYYRGELQDSRAEPVSLLEEFPLALTLNTEGL
ncbi:MAG: hypothetical protein WA771_07150 [Chthoniobacterales bacterium]